MNEKPKSQQQHTIPKRFLKNFTDRDGMLHAARKTPRTLFKGKPVNVFRRRDYYAVKEIGVSLEDKVTKVEVLGLPYVENVLRVARQVIDSVCQKTPTPTRNLRRTATLSARFQPRNRPHRHH